jgi:hypothetical protein
MLNSKLNEKELTEQGRFGVIRVAVDALFDLSILKDDFIPVSYRYYYDRFRCDQLDLVCLSPRFDPTDEYCN